MITPALAASLCAAIYKPASVLNATWDHFDMGSDDGVCWALKRINGFDVFVFRGSQTPWDWFADLMVLPIGSLVPLKTRIGHVHAGFYFGMEKCLTEVLALITQPVVVVGHSLGAAHADDLCALLIVEGKPPVGRIVFGEPNPGLADLGTIIAKVPGWSFRNGNAVRHDAVTDVPPFPFVKPTPFIACDCEPAPELFLELDAFAFHHIELYEGAFRDPNTGGLQK